MMKPKIAPSVLSADFNNLEKDIRMLNESEADFIHCDVMDGVFVPNISFGLPVIEQVHQIAQKPLDVHLMIAHPDPYIDAFARAGAEWLTVHYETCPHLHRTIGAIKEQGMKASVCLNPHTPVAVLSEIISDLDMVLLMSVNPGFGGQSFIKQSLSKISELREMADISNPNLIIQVDGGVDKNNYKQIIKSGANALVAGSAVFGADDPEETIKGLKS